LGSDVVRETLNVLLKIETDVAAASREVPTLLARRPA
jgi:hypothetical protein